MPRLTHLALALTLLLACAGAPAAEDTALRTTLEKIYHDWRSALINKNMDAWRRTTALSRQVITRNLIISGGQVYPDSIFEIPIQPPDITRLRLLECEAKGATAHLVYFGKVDLGLDADEIPDNVIVVRFINEKGAWKFDTNRIMNLTASPEVRAALQNGKADFLNDPAFTPNGVVPPTPAECRKPPYIAAVQIQSYGYETRASMSGFEYGPVADNSEQHLLMGGLAWGKNDLKLRLKVLPIPEGEERLLEVNAIIINNARAKPQVRVFSWDTQSAKPAPEIDLEVWVTGATLRGL